MPVVKFPLSKGSKLDKALDYTDALPENMIAVSQEAPNAQGYMRSHYGIAPYYESDGQSRGGEYDDIRLKEIRLMGNKLYEDGEEVADVEGDNLTSFCHSANSNAFVVNERVKFWKDGKLLDLENWKEGETEFPPEFDLSGVIDVTHNRGRYAWLTKTHFGVTSILDEQRPDLIAPFYSVESDPDGNKAINVWRDHIVVFGRNTTEFFRLTGSASSLYQVNSGMMIPAGILGTHCVCKVGDQFAMLGSIKGDSFQIMLATAGQVQKISTRSVDKILNSYTERELSESVLESVMINNQQLVYIHLPQHSFIFNAGSNTWTTIKSAIGMVDAWRGRHILFNPEIGYTVGDRLEGRVGKLDDTIGGQYGEKSEFKLYTPIMKAVTNNQRKRVFDLEFDTVSPIRNVAESIGVSVTLDGHTYNPEYPITLNTPFEYTGRTLIPVVGLVNYKLGFALRLVTDTPVNLSGFQVRVE